MAKKKSASSTATQSPALSETSATKSSALKSTSNGDASTAPDALGNDQIGYTAGAVWMLLADQGEATLASVKKEIDAPADLVLAAVGWLAREGKLKFTASGKSVKLTLK